MPDERVVPLDEIAAALESLGVKGFDTKAFLLGYVIGREWPMDAESLRRHVHTSYARRPPVPWKRV